MNTQELLNSALTQYQFLKNYDTNNPQESYNKVRNSFNSLFKKVIEYYLDNKPTEEQQEHAYSLTIYSQDGVKLGEANDATIQIKNDPLVNKPIPKDGNPHRLVSWRALRYENVKKLYLEAKQNNVPIDDGLYKRIAQIAGSTSPKVKEIINELQFNEL